MASPYRLTLKVQNNLLLNAIKDAGYRGVRHFCVTHNIHQTQFGRFVNFKESPTNKFGPLLWKEFATKICSLLKCLPEDIWPDVIADVELEKNTYMVQLDTLQMLPTYLQGPLLPSPDEELAQKELPEVINAALNKLSKRERSVLVLRFGLGDEDPHTLEECAELSGVSRERIRQIEYKGLRKLQRLKAGKDLRDYK